MGLVAISEEPLEYVSGSSSDQSNQFVKATKQNSLVENVEHYKLVFSIILQISRLLRKIPEVKSNVTADKTNLNQINRKSFNQDDGMYYTKACIFYNILSNRESFGGLGFLSRLIDLGTLQGHDAEEKVLACKGSAADVDILAILIGPESGELVIV